LTASASGRKGDPAKPPVVVIGGGLAGISAARHLRYPTVLCERENEVGGTARSYETGGFTFDHTGHLLHLHNDYTKKLVRKLLKGNVQECVRNTWIHSHGVYTRYPFQANLFGLPPAVIEECFLGLWEAKRAYGAEPLAADHPLNFGEWCQRLFGKGITKHFMEPYNRKLWQTPPTEMNADWCGQFVPQPKLEDVLAGALTDQTTAFGYNATFLYPKRGGIQVLPRALAEGLPDVRLGTSLEKLLWKERKAKLSSGAALEYAHLVSTIPLPELLKRLQPFPEELRGPLEKLRWSSVLCLNLGVKRPNISDKSWIYFPEKEFAFYRAGFPANFTPHVAPAGCSSMYVEVGHPPGKGYDTEASRQALFRKVRDGLIRCGILRKTDELPVVSFLPIRYAYVIYDAERKPALATIFAWLRERAAVSSIGRYGGWKYSFMEEAILDGKKTAEDVQLLVGVQPVPAPRPAKA
jgi:protoporphyrinogen oxidase